MKLANILSQSKKNIVVISSDPFVPTIPVVLPFHVGGKSLGSISSEAQVTQEKILAACLTLLCHRYNVLLDESKLQDKHHMRCIYLDRYVL